MCKLSGKHVVSLASGALGRLAFELNLQEHVLAHHVEEERHVPSCRGRRILFGEAEKGLLKFGSIEEWGSEHRRSVCIKLVAGLCPAG